MKLYSVAFCARTNNRCSKDFSLLCHISQLLLVLCYCLLSAEPYLWQSRKSSDRCWDVLFVMFPIRWHVSTKLDPAKLSKISHRSECLALQLLILLHRSALCLIYHLVMCRFVLHPNFFLPKFFLTLPVASTLPDICVR